MPVVGAPWHPRARSELRSGRARAELGRLHALRERYHPVIILVHQRTTCTERGQQHSSSTQAIASPRARLGPPGHSGRLNMLERANP
jgi:hypothetical protein